MGVGKQASRVGNAGTPSKRSAFLADKASKQAAATEITNAIGARSMAPKVPTISKEKNQGAAVGDVNKGRGPTRGNK